MQILSTECKAKMLDKFPSFVAYQCFYQPPSLTFSSVSEGCEVLTGYPPEVLTSGSFYFMDIVHPDDYENVKTRHESTLPIGAPVEVSFRINAKDGTQRRVLSRCRVAQTDDKGMPYIIEGFFVDITKEVQTETALVANRHSSDFLSKMGYEVRTPMNAILGLTEISLREDLPENIREYTRLIKNSGHKLMSALNNIMDFNNIESGKLKINTEEYSLPSLVNDISDIVNEQLGRLEFRVFVDSKIPARLTGDVIRLRQILLGLLSNAVKFTEKGFVSLSIEGERFGDAINLTITVKDTGRGIREEDIGSLFREFTQFDDKNVEGMGLGLTVTRRLVQLMGGDISVASGYGVGSVFTVTLEQGIPTGGTDMEPDLEPAYDFTAPDARILVVDDISANFIVAEGFLRPHNMTIDFCESGPVAIEAVKEKRYDLILMDYLMPMMSGTEATQTIRAIKDGSTDCQSVPIIALTANLDYTSNEFFRASGANDFLSKPIDGSKLGKIVRKWLPKEKQQPKARPAHTAHADFSIPGIDTQKGIVQTGGSLDIYLAVLKNFCETGRTLSRKLQSCAESGDMKHYNIYVHAIAGISKTIGAKEISKAARVLEKASANGDSDFAAKNTPEFLSRLDELVKAIEPAALKANSQTKAAETVTGAKKILMIDDTDSYLLMLDSILAGDYELLSSLDGADGLETAKLAKPDLILLDLIMPGMSGFEVLQVLKADEELKHIPVILMSAIGGENKEKGQALGAAGFIQKPFNPSTIKEFINSIIPRRKL